MKNIFLTGATGTMGMAALREFCNKPRQGRLTLLCRDSETNRKKLSPFLSNPGISVIWGDLTNPEDIERGVADADMVIHLGGIVSPLADHNPQLTRRVNIGAMENIISAVSGRPDPGNCRVIYIGSVSQYGPRLIPDHWVKAGTPLKAEAFGFYGYSKIIAERLLAESGLPRWASLRLGAILSEDLLKKGTDPITFHVPLKGVIEWTTIEDCGRLLVNLMEENLPEEFWNRFYNIGSGENFRLRYLDFERMMLKCIGAPAPEKIFEPNWFATDNFHGAWFADSDILEGYLHFRGKISAEEYFHILNERLPIYYKGVRLVPPQLIKLFMKRYTLKWPLGPLSWIRESMPPRPSSPRKREAAAKVRAFFHSHKEWEEIPSWKDLKIPDADPKLIPDSLKREMEDGEGNGQASLSNLRERAAAMGGKLISGNTHGMETPLEWECRHGHRFLLRPASLILGGHWCDKCLKEDLSLC